MVMTVLVLRQFQAFVRSAVVFSVSAGSFDELYSAAQVDDFGGVLDFGEQGSLEIDEPDIEDQRGLLEFDELFGCGFERLRAGPWRDEDFDIEIGPDNLLNDVADGKDRDITGLFGGSGFFGAPGEDGAQQGDTVYERLSHVLYGLCRFSGMDACNPSAKIGKKVKFVPIDLRLSVPWIHIWGQICHVFGLYWSCLRKPRGGLKKKDT